MNALAIFPELAEKVRRSGHTTDLRIQCHERQWTAELSWLTHACAVSSCAIKRRFRQLFETSSSTRETLRCCFENLARPARPTASSWPTFPGSLAHVCSLSPNQRACLKTSLPHPPRSLEARSSGRSRRAHRKRRPNLPRAWTRPAGVACKFAAPLQGARAFTFAVASCKTSGPRSSSQ